MELLKKNWQEIAKEANWIKENFSVSDFARPQKWDIHNENIMNHISNKWSRGWTNDPNWLNFGIVYLFQLLPNVKSTCPKTVSLLLELDKEYKIGVAGFSWLMPKSNIPLHTDDNIDFTTYHLGLDVPENCVLFSEGKLFRHENGEILTFDSNKEHSAINCSSKDRMILYMLLSKRN